MSMLARGIALLLAAVVVLTACVPEPANRPGGGDAGPTPRPTATPIPTPPGPTPTPSFGRPTPTPQPTFVLYTVVKGDTLTRIAKRFSTTKESVAYWNRATYPSLDPESTRYRPDALKVGWVLQVIPKSVVDPENLPPAGSPSVSGPPPD